MNSVWKRKIRWEEKENVPAASLKRQTRLAANGNEVMALVPGEEKATAEMTYTPHMLRGQFRKEQSEKTND